MNTPHDVRTSLMALVALLTWAAVARADAGVEPTAGTQVRATVIETTAAGKSRTRQIKGTLVDLDDASLTMTPDRSAKEVGSDSGANVVIPRTSIYLLEARTRTGHKGRGALLGFGLGAAFGALIGYAGGDDPPGIMSYSAGAKAAMGAVLLAPLGAILGAAAAPGEQWDIVPSRGVTVGLSGSPRGGAGIRLAVRF